MTPTTPFSLLRSDSALDDPRHGELRPSSDTQHVPRVLLCVPTPSDQLDGSTAPPYHRNSG